MNDHLTLADVARAMAADLPSLLAWQNMDAASPDYGATVNPAWGTDDPSAHTAAPVISAAIMLYLHARENGDIGGLDPQMLLDHAAAAAEYLLCVQRPSGFIDLKTFLPDSAADTGFTVQPLCMAIELARPLAASDPKLAELLQRLELFVRRAATGMLTGGFGTPNHRWVVCSAMAHAAALLGDIPAGPVIDSILAETIDIDREGFYMERSVGVYDAISSRSLLLLAEFHPQCAAAARDAAKKNLQLDLHLLHADATAETSLSHRQDHGVREVPLAMGPCYLLAGAAEPDPVFARAAAELWSRSGKRPAHLCAWYYYALRKFGQPATLAAKLPDDFSRWLPDNGLWRIRRGSLSASVVRGDTAILSLVYGQAELAAIKICQAYYGTGRFRADAMAVDGNTATLRFEGAYRPNRPGAFLPLGRPIPYDLKKFWGETAAQRQLRSQPKCVSELTITEVPDGLDLHYRTLDGLDRVCTIVTFDFAPGGVWQTADTAAKPHPGDELFLRAGRGRMIYGADYIEIGPGAAGHQMWQMRDSEPAPGLVRVTIALTTPIDQTFTLRVGRGCRPPR